MIAADPAKIRIMAVKSYLGTQTSLRKTTAKITWITIASAELKESATMSANGVTRPPWISPPATVKSAPNNHTRVVNPDFLVPASF